MAILHQIDCVTALKEAGYYTAAYNQILHSIKPKLTALKSDENIVVWCDHHMHKPPYLSRGF